VPQKPVPYSYAKLKEEVQRLGIQTSMEYQRRYREIAGAPYHIDRLADFVSWFDLFGLPHRWWQSKNFLSYEELKSAVREKGIQSQIEYLHRHTEITGAPSNPEKIYDDEWEGVRKFLGTEGLTRKPKVFISLDELKTEVRKKGITSINGYRASWKDILGAPGAPNLRYKRWISWEDLFGVVPFESHATPQTVIRTSDKWSQVPQHVWEEKVNEIVSISSFNSKAGNHRYGHNWAAMMIVALLSGAEEEKDMYCQDTGCRVSFKPGVIPDAHDFQVGHRIQNWKKATNDVRQHKYDREYILSWYHVQHAQCNQRQARYEKKKKELKDSQVQVVLNACKLICINGVMTPTVNSKEVAEVAGVKPHTVRAILNRTKDTRSLSLSEAKLLKSNNVCGKGHALTPDNVYWSGGHRSCKACSARRSEEQKHKWGRGLGGSEAKLLRRAA
jgi:hypothetical protein